MSLPSRTGPTHLRNHVGSQVARGTQPTWFIAMAGHPLPRSPASGPRTTADSSNAGSIIETDPNIALIEQPEYKRRWNTEPWDSQLEHALRMAARSPGELFRLRGRMKDDGPALCKLVFALVSVARRLTPPGRTRTSYRPPNSSATIAPSTSRLVAELVAAESVPLLPVLRYKPSGTHQTWWTWERTWDLQRQQDAIDVRRSCSSTDPNSLSEGRRA